MKNNSITVVIPMYNAESTIVPVLDAICAQTAVELIKAIIVINDGSVDASEEVVSEYSKDAKCKIKLITKTNGGVSSARNTGMALVDTEWIALCDSDDIWVRDKIEKQAVAVEQKRIDLIGGNHTDRPIRIWGRKLKPLHKATVKELCIKMFPQTSTVLMRKKIYDEIGGFDESRTHAEDGQYLQKIASRYEYYFMQDQLVEYGSGKRGFGVSGLSANLQKMQSGIVQNLIEARDARFISNPFYYMMRLYNWIKYVRRIIITRLTGRRK